MPPQVHLVVEEDEDAAVVVAQRHLMFLRLRFRHPPHAALDVDEEEGEAEEVASPFPHT